MVGNFFAAHIHIESHTTTVAAREIKRVGPRADIGRDDAAAAATAALPRGKIQAQREGV